MVVVFVYKCRTDLSGYARAEWRPGNDLSQSAASIDSRTRPARSHWPAAALCDWQRCLGRVSLCRLGTLFSATSSSQQSSSQLYLSSNFRIFNARSIQAQADSITRRIVHAGGYRLPPRRALLKRLRPCLSAASDAEYTTLMSMLSAAVYASLFKQCRRVSLRQPFQASGCVNKNEDSSQPPNCLPALCQGKTAM